MRKDYATRVKAANGGKLKMVTNKEGKKVPFFAADGKGKMAMGGRVKKMGGGSMMKKREAMKKGSIPPQLKKFVMAKKKKAKMKKKKYWLEKFCTQTSTLKENVAARCERKVQRVRPLQLTFEEPHKQLRRCNYD